jgi:hypothetical protein
MQACFPSAVLCAVSLLAIGSVGLAQEEDLKPLFNGKDLEGWVPVNTAPSTWSVEDGMLVCSGKPIGELRTEKMYQNFILELEWRHMKPRGNAGVFVWADDITAKGVPFHRSIEVQVLENDYGNSESHTTHGDIFPIHGATMTPINGRGNGSRAFPTEHRSKPSPEWNHYRIECQDGNISLAVNGKVVTQGKDASPRKGYICLESEGGVVHYRNLKIKQLPDTDIDPKHVAIANRGYRCLYSGLDLTGWKAEGAGFESQDWILAHVGESEGTLTTTETFGDVGFIFDVRLTKESKIPTVSVRGVEIAIDANRPDIGKHLKVGQWNRFEGELKGNRLTLELNGEPVCQDKEMEASAKGPIQIHASGPLHIANPYVRELKESSDSRKGVSLLFPGPIEGLDKNGLNADL